MVTLAGRFQVSRFLTLMQQQSTAIDTTTASLNSQGSSMREQEKYSQSLEARLNRLTNAGISLAESLGDAVLTDGLIASVEAIERLANASEDVVDTIGFLAPAFGIAGIAVAGFSTKIRGMAASIIFAETQEKRMIATTKILTGAWRGLLAATGVGLAFAVVGFSIEKLISSVGAHIQAQEELQANNEATIESLGTERERIDELRASYEKLSNVDRNTEQEAEYTRIQNELSSLLPLIKIGENEKGDAIIANISVVDDYIESLERQLEAEEALARQEAPETISENRDIVRDTKAQIAEMEQILEERQSAVLQAMQDDAVSELDLSVLEHSVERAKAKLGELYTEQTDAVFNIQEAYRSLGNTIDGISNSDVQWLSIQATDANLAASEIDKYADKILNLKDSLGEGFSLEGMDLTQLDAISGVMDNVSDSVEQGTIEWHENKNALVEAKFSAQDAVQIVNILAGEEDKLAQVTAGAADMIDEETGALDENTAEKWENAEAAEMLFGVTSAQISKMEQAIQVVATLSQMENLNAQQKEMLAGATGFLAEMYPHLSGNIAENIGWIQTEMVAMADLNGASGNNASTMMSNQDAVTRSTISASNQRITALRNEARVLQQIVNAHVAAQQSRGRTDGMVAENGFIRNIMSVRIPEVSGQLSKAYSTRQSATYGGIIPKDYSSSYPSSPRYSGGSGSSGGSSGGSGSRGGSGSSGSSGNQKSPEEIAWERAEASLQKYINKLEDYDYQISRQQSLRKQMEEGSAEYNQSINKEIDLMEARQGEINRYKSSMQKIINQDKISSENKRKLTERVRDLSLEYLELDNKIQDYINTQRESIANESIDLLKSAMNKRIELLEGERDKELSLLDERADAYSDYIDEKLNQLDREESEDDFRGSEQDLMTEQADLQNQVDILSLNNTEDAASRKRELQERLNQSILELEELRDNRTSTLRKQSLQDEKEAYQEEVESKKSAIQKQYEQQLHYYEEQLKNEQYFATLREQVMAGNMKNIQNIINGYLDGFKSYNQSVVKGMGSSWQELVNIMKTANDLTNQINNSSDSVSKSKSSGGSSSNNNSNKSSNSSGKAKKNRYHTVSKGDTLWDMAQKYYGDPYMWTKIAKANKNPDPYKLKIGNKFLVPYHKGGVVGGKSNKLTDLANSIFNSEPNEQVVKSLIGELQIPPQNIPNVFKTMGKLVSSASMAGSTGGNSYSLTIENLNGGATKQDGERLGQAFKDFIKRSGG
ncbi:LysM peptidoglycan-binding domain-containing protein [Aquibacillus saliphilus]|uniref:LysM peptidoglycan-binding domain-containing protein n=1 Tax=Aquibacillus saliphilus TaxID=1909422 RepID=UPI001CF053A4|nr:LysM peptidoglycan-binding domain-containing protein [Aquibacillus saliphilus]